MKTLNSDLARLILIEQIGATDYFMDQEPFNKILKKISDGTVSFDDYDKAFDMIFSQEYKRDRFNLLSEIMQKISRKGEDPNYSSILFRANNLIDQDNPIMGQEMERIPEEYKIRI